MARPEHMAAIGRQIMHLREGVRACLLADVAQLVIPHLSDEEKNGFSVFYREMLLGMSAAAREEGAPRRTTNHLRAYLSEIELPEAVNEICLPLIRLMEPPEPLNL